MKKKGKKHRTKTIEEGKRKRKNIEKNYGRRKILKNIGQKQTIEEKAEQSQDRNRNAQVK